MITEHDLSDPEFTERVTGELRLMADDVDADPATAEDAAAAGRRHRLRTRLLAAGSTIVAIVAVVAVFLAVQPLGAPDVATPPGTPGSPTAPEDATPSQTNAAATIPPLSEAEIDRRFADANALIAQVPANNPVHDAVADGRLGLGAVDQAFRQLQDCAGEAGAEISRADNLNMVGEAHIVQDPVVQDCYQAHYKPFRDVQRELVTPSAAQIEALAELELCTGLPRDSDECVRRHAAIELEVVDANTSQMGQYSRLVPRGGSPSPSVDTTALTEAHHELVETLHTAAGEGTGISLRELEPWLAPDEVELWLGDTLEGTAPTSELLVHPAAWGMLEESHAGHAGPFSALESLAGVDEVSVATGPQPNCASPPRPAPVGLEDLTRLAVQPVDVESCIDWFVVNLWLGDDTIVHAVQLDLHEP